MTRRDEPMLTPPVRPLDSGRHPFEVFVLFLGLVVGSPLLWGAPPPGSTTQLLGPFLAHLWGWILVGGCGSALIGVWWTWWAWAGVVWHRVRPTIATGLLIEQCGLVSVGVGTGIYTVGLLLVSDGPVGRFVPAGLVAGLGIASFVRAWQIQRWVKATILDRQQGR